MFVSSSGQPFQPNYPTQKNWESWKILKMLCKVTKGPKKGQDLGEMRNPSSETKFGITFFPFSPLVTQDIIED